MGISGEPAAVSGIQHLHCLIEADGFFIGLFKCRFGTRLIIVVRIRLGQLSGTFLLRCGKRYIAVAQTEILTVCQRCAHLFLVRSGHQFLVERLFFQFLRVVVLKFLFAVVRQYGFSRIIIRLVHLVLHHAEDAVFLKAFFNLAGIFLLGTLIECILHIFRFVLCTRLVFCILPDDVVIVLLGIVFRLFMGLRHMIQQSFFKGILSNERLLFLGRH